MPAATGDVIRVATVDELIAAVARAQTGGTILLAEGQYNLKRPLVFSGKQDVTLRSASGNPETVGLAGKGRGSESKGDDLLHVGRCDGITIADLTFADARSYGIKIEAENGPRNVHIYNCRFRDIGGKRDQPITFPGSPS